MTDWVRIEGNTREYKENSKEIQRENYRAMRKREEKDRSYTGEDRERIEREDNVRR